MLLLALTVGGSLGRHYITMFEATQNVMLKPTESWREALLDTRIMDLFLTVSKNPTPLVSHQQNHFGLFLNSFFLSFCFGFFFKLKLTNCAHFCVLMFGSLLSHLCVLLSPSLVVTPSISSFHESFPVARLAFSSYSLCS